jgi:hypothetical protein
LKYDMTPVIDVVFGIVESNARLRKRQLIQF